MKNYRSFICQFILILLTIDYYLLLETPNKCIKSDLFCNCDEKCRFFNDCCQIYNHQSEPGRKFNGDINLYSCEEYEFNRIWIINKCSDKSSRFRQSCEKKTNEFDDLNFMIPAKRNGALYRNSYCAKCNNVFDTEMVETSLQCRKAVNLTTMIQILTSLKSYKCNLTYKFGKNYERPCYPNLIRSCPLSNDSRSFECATSRLEIMMNGEKEFRNKFCCECWNTTCFQAIVQMMPLRYGYTFNINEWYVKQDTENNQNETNTKSYTFWGYYLPTSLLVLSILSLLLLIILYTMGKLFHNFAGYITICLSICLLFFNIFSLIVASLNETLNNYCRVFGVLQQYFATANFFWMSIYAVDLVHTFAYKPMAKRSINSKIFLVYCLIGFLGPFVLVLPALTLDLVDVSNATEFSLKPGYGGDFCWFTSKMGGFVWFFGPICLTLLWDSCACVIVFSKLNQAGKDRKLIHTKEKTTNKATNDSSTFWICVRLTTVFGVGYMFQIFAVLLGWGVLIHVGILLNCLQGFLLAVCFFWNRRVRNYVSSSFRSIQNSLGYSSNKSTSNDTQMSSTNKLNTNLKKSQDPEEVVHLT